MLNAPLQAAQQACNDDLSGMRPCKVLLCGEEGSGQTHVAAAFLKLLQGVPIHAISLPQLVAGGSGDTAAGLVELMREAQHR